MGGAAGFLWMAVVILALAWALELSGTVRLGVNLGFWLPVLLVLALLGAIFNMFVMPFMGRSRTTRTATSAAGTATPAAPVAAPPPAAAPAPPGPTTTAPATGSAEQEVVQETRDRPTF
ncbi:MAG TPA: hypothetical protein VK066_15250 [Chloroflexota bacterium]|nr:hypothetical protein [Chloroflexota bacterium]